MNVADDVPNYHPTKYTYCNLRVGDFGTDTHKEGIAGRFPTAFQFVDKARDKGGRVLVHCANGSNRSATVMIELICHIEGLTVNEAWQFLLTKRYIYIYIHTHIYVCVCVCVCDKTKLF